MAEHNVNTVKAQIQSLINKANETTGNTDTNLTDGVNALVSGYGQGGSGGSASLNIHYGDTEPSDTSMLWCKCDEPNKVTIKPDIVGENTIEYGIGGLASNSYGMGTVVVGDTIYIFGGAYEGIGSNSIKKYNVITGEIITLDATLSLTTISVNAFKYENKIYVVHVSSSASAFDIFDIETETVTQSTLTTSRQDGGFALCGSCIYQFGSKSSSSYYNNIVKYDLKNNTKETLDVTLPTNKCAYICAQTVGDKIYLFCGRNSTVQPYICIFDTTNNTITKSATSFDNARSHIGGSVLGTDIYLFGGWGGSTTLYYDTISVYDTLTDTIRTLDTKLQFKTYYISVARHSKNFYLFGGYNTSSIDKFTVKPLLENGCMQIQSTIKENMVDLIKGDTSIRMGVKSVCRGNANGYGEDVEAYLYQNNTWTQI